MESQGNDVVDVGADPFRKREKKRIPAMVRVLLWSTFLLLLGVAHATTYVYDANGRVVAVTQSSGISAQYTYDAIGNIVQVGQVAAGQLAIDRGQEELEALRLHAVETGDPADAADVQEYRGAIANFRGKIAEMREALVGSAMLIPIVGQNKQAAETRMMKISNGMLVVIPRLMAVASQAVVQVEIRNAAGEAEKLNEANRQITLLASKGAHDAATTAARSLGGDQRNIDVLAQVADETIKTMHEVIDIEREVAAGDREREAKLADVRNRLIKGMQGVNARSLEQLPPA